MNGRTRKPEVHTIDGYEVTTMRLRPTAALKLGPKLAKIMTPALRLQAVASAALSGNMAGAVSALAPAVASMLTGLDDDTLDMLYRDLLPDTTIVMPDDNGVLRVVELNTPQMIDIAFGDLEDGVTLLVKVMVFVAEVNFKRSFFDLVSAAKNLKPSPKTDPGSTSPTTSG